MATSLALPESPFLAATQGGIVICKEAEVQRYICSNPDCRCEKEVRAATGFADATRPRCSCGSPMKKPYRKPTLSMLTPGEVTARVQKAGLR
jgi:hypothetical protein